MKKLLLTIVLAASLLRVDSLFAWGPKGHDVVAYIAEQHLTNRARKAIDKILDGQSIVYFSSWMDNIQNSPAWEGGYDKT
ncbi:MAG: S1/P1 Nuclease, partial [Tidjanibacter sp.]|nr:S1/P1 Nuclease [Tidjanibacter sp.]